MKPVRKITFYTCIGLGLIVFIIGALFVRGLVEPVKATNIIAAAAITPTTAPPVLVQGTYANFTYPSDLKPLTGYTGASGNVLAVYNYGKPDIESWHLVINVIQLNQSSLSANSDYQLRANAPSQYQSSTMTIGDNTYTIMTDIQSGGFNKVAFSLDGDKSAEISLIGDDPSGIASLSNAFREVLQSWQWN